jgi:hypothetical protein
VRRAHQILLLASCLATSASLQAAEIYKCVGPQGRPLYTSEKRDTAGKKCKVISREVNVVPMQVPSKAGAQSSRQASFPREDDSARAAAKGRQRQILEKELANEQDMLGKARAALAEQESVRTGDERNYARVLERMKPYQDDVETHEKNVEALRRELQNLDR